jgi:hypothetical protein
MAYPTGITWRQMSPTIGGQPITQTETTPKHNLGQRLRSFDYTYGEVEFIYLVGAASTASGDVVIFDEKAATTARALKGVRGQAAVAMAAITAGLYGWYAVEGVVPVAAAGGAISAGPAYLSGTAGAIDSVANEGEKVDGFTIRGQPSGGFATCRLARPSANGNDSNALEKKGA